MAPDLEQRCPDSVRTIFISHSETADVRQFIGQYIDSRCLRCSPAVWNMVLAVLADYPVKHRCACTSSMPGLTTH